LAKKTDISNPEKLTGDDENNNTCGIENIKNTCSRLRLENNKSDQSKIHSYLQDIMMKGVEKSVSTLAPLSNAVTKILCNLFEYESGLGVPNTIITKLNKKLLKCNISDAISQNNRPPFSKGKTTTYMKPD
jgi:hypothetical protein